MTDENSRETNWWRERDDDFGAALAMDAKLLHSEQSAFQKIEILEHPAFGRILVLDGYIQASQSDEFIYHEMAVHVPLLGRERGDTSVLIVGGGEGGILREVLVHNNVTRVVMAEIDQRVVDLSNEFLGVQGNYNDPRVDLVIGDAGAYAKSCKSDGTKFDIIILDLTEPVGPSANLFTEGFLENLAGILTPDGTIIDSDSIYLTMAGGAFLQETSGGGENLVHAMRRTNLLPHMDVYRTKIPLYPGADFGFFIYSHDGVSLAEPVREYEGRHYNSAVHRAAFAIPGWQKDWLGL